MLNKNMSGSLSASLHPGYKGVDDYLSKRHLGHPLESLCQQAKLRQFGFFYQIINNLKVTVIMDCTLHAPKISSGGVN